MAGVTWAKEAREDLDAIFLRIEGESSAYAEKWIKDLFKKIELIEKFPHLGRKVPEVNLVNVREVFAGKYRVLYGIAKADHVEILAIRHTAKPLSE
ncbi:type II toxin-antitoxin system RelE/ParE family toxin [Dyadobacter sp. MSC1_007]|jgi:toxin ParE1/3/4|uniref:type II toxin-antitoxin system RelE/ParE family toxin n=1 Tax=Dyadobacter sp. MSC1_007 TaxID=2909264 RepID=UPI002030D2BE|nr:type II toxin-antitoxin system RelE/ParE family toxin [Dyadobacter sp. MSC1_007]